MDRGGDILILEGLFKTIKDFLGGKKKKAKAPAPAPKKKKRHHPKKRSLRKDKVWTRIEKVQAEQDEVLKALGKASTISAAKIVELNNGRKMPVMMKHAVLAIEKKLRVVTTENRNQRFVGAHNIAFWAFRRYGYINKRGFGMTGRGEIRNKMHKTEDGGGDKTSKYGKLYNTVFQTKSQAKDFYRHKKHPIIRS